MKGDIAFVGFMLTADEWQGLDTEARASLIAVATRRADPFLEPPRRLAEGTGKHEAVAPEPAQAAAAAIDAKTERSGPEAGSLGPMTRGRIAQGRRPTFKVDIAGGSIDASPDDEIDGDLDELLVLDTELEQLIDLVGADGEIEETLRFEALDHEAALAAAAEMAAAGVAPPVAGEPALKNVPDRRAVAQTDVDLNWAEADDDVQWAAGENWAKHGDVNWASSGGEPSAEPSDSPAWTEDDDLNWADL
jgi:hypothetical protein